MKNFFKNTETKSLLNKTLFGLIVVAFAVSTIGCSKKDSSSANRNGFYNGGGIISPGFNPQASISALGVDASGTMELSLSVSSSSGFRDYYMNGPIVAQGQLVVTQTLFCGGGSINPGTYTLTSYQQGIANNGVIQVSLQGANTQIGFYGTIIEAYPKYYNSVGQTGFDEMNATVSICGQSIYFYGI